CKSFGLSLHHCELSLVPDKPSHKERCHNVDKALVGKLFLDLLHRPHNSDRFSTSAFLFPKEHIFSRRQESCSHSDKRSHRHCNHCISSGQSPWPTCSSCIHAQAIER